VALQRLRAISLAAAFFDSRKSMSFGLMDIFFSIKPRRHLQEAGVVFPYHQQVI
jgi:hypothetical protein